jgi:hypothetical protein
MSKKEIIAPAYVPMVEVPIATVDRKKSGKEKLEKLMSEELKPVKGIFQNFETPGGSLPLQIRKFPGHFFNMVLKDGEEYEVPLYVARHLNGLDGAATAINGKVGTCSYAIHSWITDSEGKPLLNTAKRKKRFGFQSMEFAGGM